MSYEINQTNTPLPKACPFNGKIPEDCKTCAYKFNPKTGRCEQRPPQEHAIPGDKVKKAPKVEIKPWSERVGQPQIFADTSKSYTGERSYGDAMNAGL